MISVNGRIVDTGRFPDGTMAIKKEYFISMLEKSDVFNFSWYYENDEEMILLYYVVSHFKANAKKNSVFNLYLPYIPNARMDRVKSTAEVFTLKYFCNFINSMEFDEVKVLDAHSNVSLALLNNVVQDDVFTFICGAIDEFKPDILFFPDEGSCKRYASAINEYYCSENEGVAPFPIVYANKDRDWNTGTIRGIEIVGKDKVADKRVLIVDDICSKGGTFYYSAKDLKKYGAKEIALYITHCENSILCGDLIGSGLLEKIYTTNSISDIDHPLIQTMYLECKALSEN